MVKREFPVSVTDLSVGDVVSQDGIVVEIDTEIPLAVYPDGAVRRFEGDILNFDDVEGVLRGIRTDGRWAIQGNSLAYVARITD